MDLEEFGESKYAALAHDPENREVACEKAEQLVGVVKHPTLMEKVPELISVVRREGVSLRVVLAAAAALIYFVTPVDLIPDVVPVVGFLDDVGVVAAVASYVLAAFSGGEGAPSRKETIAHTDVPYEGEVDAGEWQSPFDEVESENVRNPFLDSQWSPDSAPKRNPFSPDKPLDRKRRNPFS